MFGYFGSLLLVEKLFDTTKFTIVHQENTNDQHDFFLLKRDLGTSICSQRFKLTC